MKYNRIKTFLLLAMLLTGGIASAQVIVKGNVYGGCELGKVTQNANVTINQGTMEGSVYGGGKGVETNEEAGLVKGNTTVTMTGGIVERSIYGGGELGSVGTFTYTTVTYPANDPNGNEDKTVQVPVNCDPNKGIAKVVMTGGFVGLNGSAMPTQTSNPDDDDRGWIFCGSKGLADSITHYKAIGLGVVDSTELIISDSAVITASVYGGCENGLVLGNTHVLIADSCQIGTGYQGGNTWDPRYAEDLWDEAIRAVWSADTTRIKNIAAHFHECDAWLYQSPFDVYDIYDTAAGYNSHGGSLTGTNGHSFFGNVFGGGSGYYPIAPGVWRPTAGRVNGDVVVDITGGHILTNVYGGNEHTDVRGKCTVNMSGGTVGIPRTFDQIQARPTNGYVFGAGMGDPRTMFNTWTNVQETEVNINGGIIFSSVFGGGEEGVVLTHTKVNIEETHPATDTIMIGTFGYTGFDGDVYGAGRGLLREALTAGSIGGNSRVNITSGIMLGSVYGGGSMASVGAYLVADSIEDQPGHMILNPLYGQMKPDNDCGHDSVTITGGTIGNDFETIYHTDFTKAPVGGNVFGGSKGAVKKLDNTINPIWAKMAQVKQTCVTVDGASAHIKGNVYGGCEYGTVAANTSINIKQGTIERDVFGGGYGDDQTDTIVFNNVTYISMRHAGRVFGNTKIDISGGWIKKSVYGGGELASVGTVSAVTPTSLTMSWPYKFEYGDLNGTATGIDSITVTGGRIGVTGKDFMGPWIYDETEHKYIPVYFKEGNVVVYNPTVQTSLDSLDDACQDNGDIYGGSKGRAVAEADMHFLGNVNNTVITVNIASSSATPQNYKPGKGDMEIPKLEHTSGYYATVTEWNQQYLNSPLLDCVTGAIYGGAEDGHVHEDTKITLQSGLVGHAIYGGGKGKGKYKKQYNLNAGKVYGNTEININGGYVVRSVFGGGNLASVGKGNYVGLEGGENAATATDLTAAENSGLATINIFGGQLGMLPIDTIDNGTLDSLSVVKDNIPYGSVFGGCRGQATGPVNGAFSDSADFFGYVNRTQVLIGNNGSTSLDNPRLCGSVYGGGQDGHVRRKTNVVINGGEIGLEFISPQKALDTLGDRDHTSLNWTTRGNVYGGGSGISKYKDGDEKHYSPIAGSVYDSTNVTINGGLIHRIVYGGGSLARVSGHATVTINSPIGVASNDYHDVTAHDYGGYVFGAGRGSLENDVDVFTYATTGSTEVNIASNAVVPGNVYGGGAMGQVKGSTHVKMTAGTVGTIAYDWKDSTQIHILNHIDYPMDTIVHTSGGMVFGGGKGDKSVRDAGLVCDSAQVTLSGGQVLYNIYGGGEVASVGLRDTIYDSNHEIADFSPKTDSHDAHPTGLAMITLNGGQVGPSPKFLKKQGSSSSVNDSINIPNGLNGLDGLVFGGGKGIGDDPITGTALFGKYYQLADVNHTLVIMNMDMPIPTDSISNRLWGSIYGGAEDGHVLGSDTVRYINGLLGTTGTSGFDGNIFGGGRNESKKNYSAGRTRGNNTVEMTGGQIFGNIYGGGRLALTGVDMKGDQMDGTEHGYAKVMVKGGIVGNNTKTNANAQDPNEMVIEVFSASSMGSVYGGGRGDVKGIDGHPAASALRLGLVKNSEVEISDTLGHNTHVYGIVFGGGEVANVGKYTWQTTNNPSAPPTISNITLTEGLAKVNISGGIIGGDRAKMRYEKDPSYPIYPLYNDDLGYVYGGGEGVSDNPKYYALVQEGPNATDTTRLVNLLATVNNTEVTVSGGWVKGSVFGGAEAGHVRGNTLVTIQGGQIGAGDDGTNDRLYTDGTNGSDNQFINPTITPIDETNALFGTTHWRFGDTIIDGNDTTLYYPPYDPVLAMFDTIPSDGKSWFGNVFGGGSGWFPYIDTVTLSSRKDTIRSRWNPLCGKVWGNTHVVVEGGHILNNVYGANEATDIGGNALVEIKGGTVGVPRTKEQIIAQPCSGCVFGGGCGDPREVFDTITLVDSTNVIVTGGIIYGSVYGGAEDGHVKGSTSVTVSQDLGRTTVIGCAGLSTADGNIFGGGRNFLGGNKCAGRVEGNIAVTMTSGTILGSIFGGGRQALSGVNAQGYFPSTAWPTDKHGNVTINVSGTTETVTSPYTSTDTVIFHTNIGNYLDQGIHLLTESDESVGDIFGSGKGDTKNYMDTVAGRVTNATINITGSPRIHGAVFGGGEMASLGWWNSDGEFYDNTGEAIVTIGTANGTDNPVIGTFLEQDPYYLNDQFSIAGIQEHSEWTMVEEVDGKNRLLHSCTGNVFGGCQGDVDFEDWVVSDQDTWNNWPVMGRSRTATVTIYGGTIMSNVHGGSEQGTITGDTRVSVYGGTIGNLLTDANGEQYKFGSVYGAGYGSDDPSEDNYNINTFNNITTRTDSLAGRTFGNTQVDILGGTIHNSVFGGGAFAFVGTDNNSNTGDATVNIGDDEASHSQHTVMGDVYGGNNRKGSVLGNVEVNINAGILGAGDIANKKITRKSNVFGGGYGEQTATHGNVTVTVDTLNNSIGTTIFGDVYGGSAFGTVNGAHTDTTSVNILAGIIATDATPQTTPYNNTYYIYDGGNVFGGGLGESGNTAKGNVNGKIFVNIGSGDIDNQVGEATIYGNVYGCNDTGGSPQDSVTVNIYKTAFADTSYMGSYLQSYSTYGEPKYAIDNVFGGGNRADYTASNKRIKVNVYSCDNSVRRVFGGGNAAASNNVYTEIQGGRFDKVFGGGNGELGQSFPANITGYDSLVIHGGTVNQFFVGSNENGSLTSNNYVGVLNDGACAQLEIDEFFCGGNYVGVWGNVDATIECNNAMVVRNLYGGCNQALIRKYPDPKTTPGLPQEVVDLLTANPTLVGTGGNVNLTVCGGQYENIYGGSKGRLATDQGGIFDAYIEGDVTVTIKGGTIDTVFGGSNKLGNIHGRIIVNINEDTSSPTCPLELHNVYGGGRGAYYQPDTLGAYPEVNILNGVVSKKQKTDDQGQPVQNSNGDPVYEPGSGSVFGGGYGSTATVTSPSGVANGPKVTIGDKDHSNNEATVEGNVYGGGHGADVTGNTNVILDGTSKVDVLGNVYGGGKNAQVTGNAKVEIKEPTQP